MRQSLTPRRPFGRSSSIGVRTAFRSLQSRHDAAPALSPTSLLAIASHPFPTVMTPLSQVAPTLAKPLGTGVSSGGSGSLPPCGGGTGRGVRRQPQYARFLDVERPSSD